jgi:PPOX class probable F420-dependent enzyme
VIQEGILKPTGPATITPRAAEILSTRPLGYMATVRPDGRISVVPVAVIFDGETVRLTSVKSRFKVRNLEQDARITLCVPHPENSQYYVEIRGTATIDDDADRSFVNAMAKDWMGMDEYPYDRPGEERVTITVHPEVVSMPKVHGAD